MVRPNFAYPPGLKTVLKCAPVCIFYFLFGSVFSLAMYNILYHPHERICKFHFKSSGFDKKVRSRDMVMRNYYLPMIEW